MLKARDEDLRKQGKPGVERVTLVGLCTDICVISNALLVKAFLPEAEVAAEFGVPCQVSMEERMGCGVGACLGVCL